MHVCHFNFQLPKYLIAQYPKTKRSSCRLLSLDGNSGTLMHGIFTDILDKINPGDLLIFNNTRVIPARIYGRKISGGKIEILVERILDDRRILAHVRTSTKTLKPGAILLMGEKNNVIGTILSYYNALFEIIFESDFTVLDILNSIGHIPLPPYINRPDETIDYELYQTVYSTRLGAVAAPTAGLHFDQPLIDALKKKGVEIAFVTLHIGAGTFKKLKITNITEHIMHTEYVEVSQETVNAVIACKTRGNKVIAIGTTSVRSLESAATNCKDTLIAPFIGHTQIFIYPSYQYKVIDTLITNFHLPQSTLIMLVSAFAGYQNTMRAYRTAIIERYRFFSYGDAMYITHNPQAPDEHF
ncbi:tRNA preQ1(34) S-adenosylmethionine ribosyltransferase-isomerase QueA [Candidatus Pantoea carbekii]|uniref:S-adenosylmethionine:tRNA ribosyltransferase-isomerase n=1 Tax=Candidatus Pantoea carbekii TaxID=1235990 RepID=U3U3M1_9GAMM|nr:tRNA preQ1(34) S-adenosylmethionine ribosyltransferase-isomerase QueA [Candidatus Pantoea carbekii]AKC32235.1 S-adenosylmethionine:tRNA ribosyltransferase-isomerase QueA [Candidatus Pantoea carbekii]BAO00771.1 QueA protein [Candidatus Pantoea carbekii]